MEIDVEDDEDEATSKLLEGSRKAVQMLGGLKKLSERFGDKEGFLELKFRPNDPFSHGIWGDRVHTSNLLLKVTPEKSQSSTSTSSSASTTPGFSAEIVGKVPFTYKFRGMADFQFLLPKNEEKRRVLLEQILPDTPTVAMDEKDMFLPPPLFAKQDIPFAYKLSLVLPLLLGFASLSLLSASRSVSSPILSSRRASWRTIHRMTPANKQPRLQSEEGETVEVEGRKAPAFLYAKYTSLSPSFQWLHLRT